MSEDFGSETSNDVSRDEDQIPFLRHALDKLLKHQNECIDDNNEVWLKIKRS